MIDRAHDLPITRQAEALNISLNRCVWMPRHSPRCSLPACLLQT